MMAGVFTKNMFGILTVYAHGLILRVMTKAMVMARGNAPNK